MNTPNSSGSSAGFQWKILDELHAATQQWPLVILVVLAGGLIGWIAASLQPAGYLAHTSLYVAFNGDAMPRNPDDHKNWQMEQFDAFILSTPVLEETVQKLEVSAAGLSLQELEARLSARWRNAGEWTLAAQAGDEQTASETLRAWQAAVFDNLDRATTHAEIMLDLERELVVVSNRLYTLRQQRLSLESARASLETWVSETTSLGGETPPSEGERWRLQSLAAQVSPLDPIAASRLEEFPPAAAPPAAYLDWVARVLASAQVQAQALQVQESELENRRTSLSQRWREEENLARGITAFLYVEPLMEGEITVEANKVSGLAALIGAFCGLLLFLLYRLARAGTRPSV